MTHVGSTIRTQVRTHGAVTPDATDYAVAKLDAALHHAPAPVVGSWLSGSAPACGACAAVPPMTHASWLSPVTTSLSTGYRALGPCLVRRSGERLEVTTKSGGKP